MEQPSTEEAPLDTAAKLAKTALLSGPRKADGNHGECALCLSTALEIVRVKCEW
jgi:hypothetical protein